MGTDATATGTKGTDNKSTLEPEPANQKQETDASENQELDESNAGETQARTGTEEFNIDTAQQMQFGESGLEPKDDVVETTLESFDVDIDHQDRESRIDQPEATDLMVDDRPESEEKRTGEQGTLFADTNEDQQTLTGKSAHNKCMFEDN